MQTSKTTAWLAQNCRFAAEPVSFPEVPPAEGRDELEMDEKFYSHEYDPRPHGFEIRKPTPIRVTAAGTLPYDEFIGFVKDHVSYEDGSSLQHWKIRGDPAFAHAAYVVTNTSSLLKEGFASDKHIYFNDGWDSSYHDAHWTGQCALAAFGPTPEAAQALLDEAFSAMVPAEDPIAKRFKMRQLVRPGD